MLRAAARVREAYLALRRVELLAPVDGYVARRSVQLGQRVQAGTPLLSVIALDDVWVDANFKEGQLRNLRIGQPVELQADVYGKKVDYHGTIEGLGAGTGAAFALLPAQNATGNWIKVVQRVPVRIALDPKEIGRASAARRPVDGREGRRQQDRWPHARRCLRPPGPFVDHGVRRLERRGRCRREEDHRRQRRPRPPTPARRVPRASTGRLRRSRPGLRRGALTCRLGVAQDRRRGLADRQRTPRRWRPGHARAQPQSLTWHLDRAAPAPLTGSALVLGTIALSLATFMNVLDSSIANVSIPAIAGDMGVSPSQGTWVITSFAVANAISVPLTGWLTQRFGPVRLFVSSIVLFVIASWLCGLAPNIGMLIAFRVLQGLVAGPMIPLSQTLLLSSYPRAKAGTAMAMWAMTMLVAPVAGPLLGGWITDNISWPWIFYINIPVGLVAAAITWSIYRSRDPGSSKAPLDYVGLGLLVRLGRRAADHGRQGQGARLVQLDPDRRPRRHGGDRLRLLPRLGADRKAPGRRPAPVRAAQFPLGHAVAVGRLRPLLRQRRAAAALAAAVHGLHRHLGRAGDGAGRRARHHPVALGRQERRQDRSAQAHHGRVPRLRPRAVDALALQRPGRLSARSSIPTILQGAAMAFFFIPLQAIIFSGLSPDRLPAAAGLSNFVRITAGAIGTSIFTTVWENRAILHHAEIAETVTRSNDAATLALGQLGASGYDGGQALATINRLVDQQSYTMAATDLFLLSGVLFIVLLVFVWMTKPALGGAAGAGGAH